MVWAPASTPRSVSSLRRETISSSMAAGTRVGEERAWAPRLRLHAFVAQLPVTSDQLIQPAAGDVVGFADVVDAAALDQHGVDDIASQIHAHGPPWSCPLCLATRIRDLLKPDTATSTTVSTREFPR